MFSHPHFSPQTQQQQHSVIQFREKLRPPVIVMAIAKVSYCSFRYFRSLSLCIRRRKLVACCSSCAVQIRKVRLIDSLGFVSSDSYQNYIRTFSDKAMAMGIIQFAIGLFGNVPCPIIYGVVIDSTCLVWERICGKDGACSLYDIDDFRHFFLGKLETKIS